MKISVKTYIISGTVALLAILIYSFVPQSIPIDPNGKTSQPNKSESGVAKSENATLEKSNVSLGSRKNLLINNKYPDPKNFELENLLIITFISENFFIIFTIM